MFPFEPAPARILHGTKSNQRSGALDHWRQSSAPQSSLLEQRHHRALEVRHLLVVVEKSENHALDSRPAYQLQRFSHWLGRADERIPAPSEDEAFAEALALLLNRTALDSQHFHY